MRLPKRILRHIRLPSGGKQWQTTPKNLPRMLCVRANFASHKATETDRHSYVHSMVTTETDVQAVKGTNESDDLQRRKKTEDENTTQMDRPASKRTKLSGFNWMIRD